MKYDEKVVIKYDYNETCIACHKQPYCNILQSIRTFGAQSPYDGINMSKCPEYQETAGDVYEISLAQMNSEIKEIQPEYEIEDPVLPDQDPYEDETDPTEFFKKQITGEK